jgi:hypothetical protein
MARSNALNVIYPSCSDVDLDTNVIHQYANQDSILNILRDQLYARQT